MRRFVFMIALVALAGCATVYEDHYGYHPGDSYGGDYYYDPDPWGYEHYGYSAYDSLFWGLRYSYFDPFYYPYFHYGVTYFPSYYGWSYWQTGDYWRWRHFHPYSPYYGSWWDHYYDWPRPAVRKDPRERLYGERGRGDGNSVSDPLRYGSARNAAERMARLSRPAAGSSVVAPASIAGPASRSRAPRTDVWQESGLPSRGYVPASRRQSVDSPAWSGPIDSGRFQRPAERSGRGNRTAVPMSGQRETSFSTPASRAAQAPRADRQESRSFSDGRSISVPSRSASPVRAPERGRENAGRER